MIDSKIFIYKSAYVYKYYKRRRLNARKYIKLKRFYQYCIVDKDIGVHFSFQISQIQTRSNHLCQNHGENTNELLNLEDARLSMAESTIDFSPRRTVLLKIAPPDD